MSMTSAIALAFLLAPGVAAGQPSSESAAVTWVRAVEQHQPGTTDRAALTVAEWGAGQLESALRGLRDYLVPSRGGDTSRVNEVLVRGALLHTDIAMLLPDRAARFRGLATWPIQGSVLGLDGEVVANEAISGHWEFARVLLDRVRPDPARDEFVRRWYVAVATYVQREASFAVALPHLSRARRLLRNDADILFLTGAMHEAFAAPRHHAILRTFAFRTRQRVAIDPPGTELRRAERFFRDALQQRPGMAEARTRLGRVLGVMGRHADAASELRRVVSGLGAQPDPVLAYYAYLFLGQEEAALGRRDVARECFEAALRLYPDAQSPQLSLSALARSAAERNEAFGAVRTLSRVDVDERRDPWWIYTIAQGRDADALLVQLRAPLLRSSDRPRP